jgi:hypothetical protein
MSIVSTSTHSVKYVSSHFRTWREAMLRARSLGHNCPPDTTLGQFLEYIKKHGTETN